MASNIIKCPICKEGKVTLIKNVISSHICECDGCKQVFMYHYVHNGECLSPAFKLEQKSLIHGGSVNEAQS